MIILDAKYLLEDTLMSIVEVGKLSKPPHAIVIFVDVLLSSEI